MDSTSAKENASPSKHRPHRRLKIPIGNFNLYFKFVVFISINVSILIGLNKKQRCS